MGDKSEYPDGSPEKACEQVLTGMRPGCANVCGVKNETAGETAQFLSFSLPPIPKTITRSRAWSVLLLHHCSPQATALLAYL